MRRLDWIELELLRALFELRYLGSEQIRKTWYPHRSKDACGQRLRRLRRDKYVVSKRLNHDRWQFAWRLGPEGLRVLRRNYDGDFEPYKNLAPSSLPHLLDTNEVYLTLAHGCPTFSEVPFEWRGSHKAQLVVGHRGKKAVHLHPDAIITPEAPTGRRIFLELDRGTEAIRKDSQRATIERKIERFDKYAAGVTNEYFGDGRFPLLLFVVPEGAHRRLKNVLAVAKKNVSFDCEVEALTLDDVWGIRGSCHVVATAVKDKDEPAVEPKLCEQHIKLFRELFGLACQYREAWEFFETVGKVPSLDANGRLRDIENRLKRMLGTPPVKPEPRVAESPESGSPEGLKAVELQVLFDLYRELDWRGGDERSDKLKSGCEKIFARLGEAFAEQGEPQALRKNELNYLLGLYTVGRRKLRDLAAGSIAHAKLEPGVCFGFEAVKRLSGGDESIKPPPAKQDRPRQG